MTEVKLTEAQRRWLVVLSHDPVGSFGVPIGLMELADEGFVWLLEYDLVELRRSSMDGISATITREGLALLRSKSEGSDNG